MPFARGLEARLRQQMIDARLKPAAERRIGAALASAPWHAQRLPGEWARNWRMGGGDSPGQGGPGAFRRGAQLCASRFRRGRDRGHAAHGSCRASFAQRPGVDRRRFRLRRRDRGDWFHPVARDPVRDRVPCGNDERRHGRRDERQRERRRTPFGAAAHVLVSRRIQFGGRERRCVGRMAWGAGERLWVSIWVSWVPLCSRRCLSPSRFRSSCVRAMDSTARDLRRRAGASCRLRRSPSC